MDILHKANIRQLFGSEFNDLLSKHLNESNSQFRKILRLLDSYNAQGRLARNDAFDSTLTFAGILTTNSNDQVIRLMPVLQTPAGEDGLPPYAPRVSTQNFFTEPMLKMFPPEVASKLRTVTLAFGVRTSYVVPLQFLIKSAQKVKDTYTVYLSRIYTPGMEEPYLYVGITKRPPWTRLKEHIQAARQGSPYLHARKLREHMEAGHDVLIEFEVYASGLSQDSANDLEEYFVDKFSWSKRHKDGLNMIPGGYAGARYLAALANGSQAALSKPESREALLKQWLDEHPLRGRENPAVAEMWNDPEYAEAIICGPEGRLSPEQIREARHLAIIGFTIREIVAAVNAKNERQIKNVLSGKTYGRIH